MMICGGTNLFLVYNSMMLLIEQKKGLATKRHRHIENYNTQTQIQIHEMDKLFFGFCKICCSRNVKGYTKQLEHTLLEHTLK